jgi:hypothetical protein
MTSGNSGHDSDASFKPKALPLPLGIGGAGKLRTLFSSSLVISSAPSVDFAFLSFPLRGGLTWIIGVVEVVVVLSLLVGLSGCDFLSLACAKSISSFFDTTITLLVGDTDGTELTRLFVATSKRTLFFTAYDLLAVSKQIFTNSVVSLACQSTSAKGCRPVGGLTGLGDCKLGGGL